MKNLFFISLLMLLLSGCYSTRFHSFGEVPKKPGKRQISGDVTINTRVLARMLP